MLDELLYLFLRALEFDGDDPLPLINEWNSAIAHVQEVFDRMTDKDPRLVNRKRGYWKPVSCREMYGGDPEAWYGHGDPIACHLCSQCNGYPWFDEDGNEALTSFCPNCGADMRDEVEVKHGHWIKQAPDFDLCGVEYYRCSECGKEQQTPSHYCQFCGARMEGRKWCVWQDEDNEGVYCTAHIHEDRVLNCPYKNLGERQRADYPCQDYRPMNGGQHE